MEERKRGRENGIKEEGKRKWNKGRRKEKME